MNAGSTGTPCGRSSSSAWSAGAGLPALFAVGLVALNMSGNRVQTAGAGGGGGHHRVRREPGLRGQPGRPRRGLSLLRDRARRDRVRHLPDRREQPRQLSLIVSAARSPRGPGGINIKQEPSHAGVLVRALDPQLAESRYPEGLPPTDYIPLFALLGTQVTDEDLHAIADQLASESDPRVGGRDQEGDHRRDGTSSRTISTSPGSGPGWPRAAGHWPAPTSSGPGTA